ncbi:hypothetical protein DITRI_Ditri17bG0127900 [Diplodiscus trichospermus]
MSTMAEQTPLKRQREETQSSDEVHVVEETKRHKSYNHILSLLEAEEDEPNQDLSSLITTLQQELSSDSLSDDPLPCPTTTTTLEADDQENPNTTILAAEANSTCTITEDYTSATSCLKEDEDQQDDKERVIRHLLEASDDELGIPNREDDGVGVGVEVVEYEEERFNNDGNGFPFCDGLWELEDETANYYALLQSELFM